MAAKTKERVLDMAGSAKPYVDRALHDDELRDHVRQAYSAARAIYDQLVAPRGVTGLAVKVAGDEDIQANLRRTVQELRQAADRLHGREQQHRSRGATLLVAGIAIGILFNPVTGPDTRRWLKSKLFGGGDEFGYQSSGNGSGGE